jgi:hypothetical protein
MRNLKIITGSMVCFTYKDSSSDNFDIIKDVFKIAENLGIPYNNDFNGVRQNGVGRGKYVPS